MEESQRGYSLSQTEQFGKPKEKTNDRDDMIKEMSERLPRSEYDEFESNHFTPDWNNGTANNK